MKKVRYEEMLPYEVVKAREEKPVAYLPIGGIEWHGEHNPLGLDTVKAHELCIRAAQKGGGLAMPPLFWGESRKSHLLEYNYNVDNKVTDKMHLKPFTDNDYMGGISSEEEQAFYEHLLTHIYYELKSLGFRAIFVLCGHYPLKEHAVKTAQKFMEKNPEIKIYAGIEADPVRDIYPNGGDHAGKWETSIMATLRPELVDISMLGDDMSVKPIGVYGEDPRCDDLKEFGQKVTQDIINRMIKITDNMLKELGLL
ncbi:MAG: creatininase family protein [Candidatus Poribacteria bacterium]